MTFSPEFLERAKRSPRWLLLLVRLPVGLLILPVGLLGALLEWLGQFGDTLKDTHDQWRHELWAVTTPPVWTELIDLERRASRAEERLRLLGAAVD